jgi:hypothetical protein
MKLLTPLLLLLLAFAPARDDSSYKDDLPVDRQATKETLNLYRNLKKLMKKGIMFGHQDDLAYGVGWKYEAGRSDVKDVTGDYPAVYGFELGHLEIDAQINLDSVPFNKMKEFIREVYERGGVVTLSWHLIIRSPGNQPGMRFLARWLPFCQPVIRTTNIKCG